MPLSVLARDILLIFRPVVFGLVQPPSTMDVVDPHYFQHAETRKASQKASHNGASEVPSDALRVLHVRSWYEAL